MNAHTPGPWRRDTYGNVFAEGKPPVIIAEVGVSFWPNAVSQANARLIAAAPDMAAALTELARCLAVMQETDALPR